MLIEHQCERLIKLFAVLNDQADYQRMVEMFTPDGCFARPSQPDDLICGREAILDAFRKRPVRVSRHFVTNTLVEVEDENTASAQSYILLFTGEAGEVKSDPPYLIGTFRDRLVRLDGEWRFKERRGSVDLKAG